MHEVFISYSSADQKIADAVVGILESRKIKCWIAYRDADAGDEYAVSIVRAIKQAKCAILILSETSNCSKHVLNEINSCVNHGISIIPFRISDVMLHEAIEYYLGKTHWLDAITAPLEAHIHKLADRVDTFLDKKEYPVDSSAHRNDNANTANVMQTRTADYATMISLGYDTLKIAMQLVENDYINFNGLGEDNEGNAQQWADFIEANNQNFRYILNGCDNIVGEASMTIMTDELHALAMEGRALEKDFSRDNTISIPFFGLYHCYILTLSLLPHYRNVANYKILAKAFWENIQEYAEQGIFFTDFVYNAFSKETEDFCKTFGFVYKCDNISFGKVYTLDFTKRPKSPFFKTMPRLMELYEEYFDD